jgi:hypothetical protein
MASTLRQLLIQRAARLQERPALSTPDWGTLGYGQFRNRVEGVALGLLATPRVPGSAVFHPGSGPWGWAAEVAAACCGLRWEPGGAEVGEAILGGPRFNDEEGRGPYHDREEAVGAGLAFHGGLSQGEVLRRLARLNVRLGWDHDHELRLPLDSSATPEGRAALWSALYAGAHAKLETEERPRRRWFGGKDEAPPFDPEPFRGFWDPGPE